MDPFSLIVVVVAAAYIAAVVYAIVQVIRSKELSDLERVVWVLAVVFFPFVATLVWFIAGPHPFGLRLTRDLR
ncbi:PLDc N-terminal domain-containing protein [Agromyces aureus]|uniref:Cardiolipin synthase N-terminal domain-containing protein n=1 Tax=Agromyces aureus TaxID=453304 RepID=A0A191WGJ9_9MICO|nr:PLDc N-terminal domain-containing protein [Agromyces aureus]ANJ27352.1 hypothetical protein ATC03_12115 [Agromyces aureus]